MKPTWISKNSIHFKVYGNGPPLVLFHPSPNSSAMMHDLAMQLASSFMVICPDTPGYGSSPKLKIENPTMKDFAEAFKIMFDDLGFNKIAIYGSATGSQIGIRYGIEYPDQIDHLFLDNCAHFTDDERVSILRSYFPDLTPRLDGDHLVQIWDMVNSLFQYFPWCFKDHEHKLKTPMPPVTILHGIVKDYLKAGVDYDIAYKAAFAHEKVDYIQKLKVPTSILRWQGSILKSYTDRLFDYDLPENVKGQKISADRSLRFKEIAKYINDTNTSSENILGDSITEKLEKYRANNSMNVFKNDPPAPDVEGYYLIKAWHELRDKALLDSGGVNLDPEVLQSQFVQWFCHEDKAI